MFTLTLAAMGAVAALWRSLYSLEKRLLRIEAHIKSELGGGAMRGNIGRHLDDLGKKIDDLTHAMLGTDRQSGIFERLRKIEEQIQL